MRNNKHQYQRDSENKVVRKHVGNGFAAEQEGVVRGSGQPRFVVYFVKLAAINGAQIPLPSGKRAFNSQHGFAHHKKNKQ